ncbi:MAG: hypothetical protein ACRDYY_16240 [Acidimicrobiales bacterium]
MVVDDPAEAARLVAAGQAVVLIVAEGVMLRGGWPAGPGRMAVMVGDAGDPAVREAAEAMAAELFGRG